MKTTFVFAGLLATTLAAHAESLTLKVPFAFSVPGKTLPAGEYSVKTFGGTDGVLSIQGAGSKVLVFGRSTTATSLDKPAVEFKNTALVGVTLGGIMLELNESSNAEVVEPILTASASE